VEISSAAEEEEGEAVVEGVKDSEFGSCEGFGGKIEW
jgi:hypothetical protein